MNEKMQAGRAEKFLNKKFIFSGNIVTTWKEWIDTRENEIEKLYERQVPKVEYNRRKAFGMNDKELEEYERKTQELKTEYCVQFFNGDIYKLPKIVYDYITKKILDKHFLLYEKKK